MPNLDLRCRFAARITGALLWLCLFHGCGREELPADEPGAVDPSPPRSEISARDSLARLEHRSLRGRPVTFTAVPVGEAARWLLARDGDPRERTP